MQCASLRRWSLVWERNGGTVIRWFGVRRQAGLEEEDHEADGAENLDGRRKRKKGKVARRTASARAPVSSEDDDEDDLYTEPPKKARKSENTRGRKK